MPTYIYRIQPVRPEMLSEGATAEEERIAGEHFEYLKRLMAEGILILAGRTLNSDYSAFGIAIFEARDDAHMREITARTILVWRRNCFAPSGSPIALRCMRRKTVAQD